MMWKNSVHYLAIFIFSLSHQLSDCSSFNFTGNANKTIPAVCTLTIRCPGASSSDVICEDNSMSDVCTFNASTLNSTTTFCNGSNTITVNTSINVAIAEENNEFNIISEGLILNCTPVVSCNETIENITWAINGTTDVSLINRTLPVKAKDYGNYTCTVTNGNMKAMITYYLYGGPKFNTDSESQRVTLNDRVTFNCKPTNDTFPTTIKYEWMKDGNNLANQSAERFSIEEARFTIKEARYDDEGVYHCIASHQYNNASKRFELKVKSPLTPLWPAIGIIVELSLVAAIILVYEFYRKRQEKNNFKPTLEEEKDNDTGAYNFPSHFTSHGQRHNSITKESLLPDSVQ